MNKLTITIGALILVLALGCSSEPAPNIEATVEARVAEALAPTSTPIPVVSDSTPDVTPTSSAILEATPTKTPTPTRTPIPTKTPTPTRTPTPTMTPTPAPLTATDIFENNRKAIVKIESNGSVGTGFIIDPDGWVVTNAHLFSDGASVVRVTTYNGSSQYGLVTGRKATEDLALLKISVRNYPTVTIGNSDLIKIG